MAEFVYTHSDDSFVTVTANFNYSGPEAPYAYFVGYMLTPSGKQKIPSASINTIVDLDDLESGDVSDIFMLNDITLFSGLNEVTFTFSPSKLMESADEIARTADLATFGVIVLTDEELEAVEEEFYEGEDPYFELEAIPDTIVSSATGETYTLTASEKVFWYVASVKLSGMFSTSDEEEDDSNYLDITLETIKTTSEDEAEPDNYGKDVSITVSSIAGYTPKGEYEITVQRSADGEEWTNAGVLNFTATNSTGDDESSTGNSTGDTTGNNSGNGDNSTGNDSENATGNDATDNDSQNDGENSSDNSTGDSPTDNNSENSTDTPSENDGNSTDNNSETDSNNTGNNPTDTPSENTGNDTDNSDDSENIRSSSSCNAGSGFETLFVLLGGLVAFRRKS